MNQMLKNNGTRWHNRLGTSHIFKHTLNINSAYSARSLEGLGWCGWCWLMRGVLLLSPILKISTVRSLRYFLEILFGNWSSYPHQFKCQCRNWFSIEEMRVFQDHRCSLEVMWPIDHYFMSIPTARCFGLYVTGVGCWSVPGAARCRH